MKPRIYLSLEEAGSAADIHSLAMGFFDGLHQGHKAVINLSRQHQDPAHCAVLTFQTHPQAVLFPERAPTLLTGWPHKLHRLEELEVHHILALPFNQEVARIEATDFLSSLAASLPQLRKITVGPNWRFGRARKGTLTLLEDWCRSMQVELAVAAPAVLQGEIISSSRVRDCVHAGRLDEATTLLGHPYGLYGTVGHGHQLGQKIGVPTLNLETEDGCLPPFGVYAGWTRLEDGKQIPSAINIGLRPTVEPAGSKPVIESHLLDYNGDLYGRHATVCPVSFIRPEIKFSSTDTLKKQIELDLAEIRKVLAR